MGNGNHSHLDDRLGVGVLLTPHGEREHVTPYPCIELQLLLLTPHGERELDAGLECDVTHTDS